MPQRIFLGWWVVGTSFSMFALQNAAFGFTFGAYLLEVEEHFGWNRFTISTAFAVSQLVSGFLAPGQGWLIDRFGARGVLRLGIVMFGLAFMLLSVVEELWMFFATVIALGVGSSLSGYLTLHTSVTLWFQRKRSLALGIATTGLGLGGALATITVWSLVTHGWRATALGSGMAILVIGLPLSQLLLTRPQDYGQRPDGASALPNESAVERARSADDSNNFTVGEALRDRSFWLLSAGHGVALVSVFAVIVHLVPHLVESRGWSATSAQAMFIVVTTASVFGQLVGGFLGDRYSKINIAAACMLGHGVALLMLAFGEGALVAPAVGLHGLSWGTRGPLMTAIRADYFGTRHYGTIMGSSLAFVMIGTLIGPSFAGAMNDHYGDYIAAFWIIGIVTAVSAIFFLLARKPPLPPRLRALPGSAGEER